MGDGGVIFLSTRILRRPEATDGLPAGDYLSVAVQDNGEGMDEATLARVFEPFFSTKPVGKGTGLGLSQVYGFVRQSGGGVTVHSRLGGGTTVTLLLPLIGSAEVTPGGDRPEIRRETRPLSVLLVEDDSEVATLAEAMLRELGHEVYLATSAAEALERVRTDDRFTLMLTDVVMPGELTGVDLAREATLARPGLPVLLSSGYTGEILDTAEDAPWRLLRKPYTLDGLARAIEDAVEGVARPYAES
jgi:CheY-like chemotaxis protein